MGNNILILGRKPAFYYRSLLDFLLEKYDTVKISARGVHISKLPVVVRRMGLQVVSVSASFTENGVLEIVLEVKRGGGKEVA